MKLQRRESTREVSPQPTQPGSPEGVPVPDAVAGLRIKILRNIEYDTRVPAQIKQRYASAQPE